MTAAVKEPDGLDSVVVLEVEMRAEVINDDRRRVDDTVAGVAENRVRGDRATVES